MAAAAHPAGYSWWCAVTPARPTPALGVQNRRRDRGRRPARSVERWCYAHARTARLPTPSRWSFRCCARCARSSPGWHQVASDKIAYDPLGVVADRRITTRCRALIRSGHLHTRAEDYAPGTPISPGPHDLVRSGIATPSTPPTARVGVVMPSRPETRPRPPARLVAHQAGGLSPS